MRIAVFDYKVVANNPIGGCHLRMLEKLCGEHEFTVFALRFDNPRPDRIRFVRVPAPARPLALLFVAYHLLAPLCYILHRTWRRTKFDVVQSVESNLSFGSVSYAQFCHRAFLREHWPQVRARGLRGWLRWWDHWLHARLESPTYRRCRHIVVPSPGLGRELATEFPAAAVKISTIPNPVDIDRLQLPDGFDRPTVRRGLGLTDDQVMLLFVALGHFERKGLPLLLDALGSIRDPALRLVVVGGEPDLVGRYRRRVAGRGLEGRVHFAGMQRDVRPFLWAADAFTLPSYYEAFPLVCLEAAASGLPLIVSPLNGVEDLLCDGENGILVAPTGEGVADGIARFLRLTSQERANMGARARSAVAQYSTAHFIAAWRRFYRALDAA